MSETAPINLPRPAYSLAISLSFYVLLISISLIQVFGIFRGLSSAAGMDQAQIARELARGHGFHTKFIRPYAWQQMIAAGKDVTPTQMPDTYQPPVQPLIWAPIFKALERYSTYEPATGSAMYLLDRVIGCLGAFWFLLTIGITHLTIRKLFDDQIAIISSLILVLCQPLWEIAVSGSPQALVMLWTAFALWCFTSALQKSQFEQSPWRSLIGVSVACGLLALTHWMALWIVIGFIVAAAMLMKRRSVAVFVVASVPAICLVGWCVRNYVVCGDALGAAKATFQSLLVYGGDEPLQRDFILMNPAVAVDSLFRKLALNFQAQWHNSFLHLVGILPAFVFFFALMHRFRRPEVGTARWALTILWVMTAVGMAMLGLKSGQPDENDLYCALVPAMTGFGVAMLAMFWARLNLESGWFWRQWGYAVIAITLSAMPMFTKLPTALRIGIAFRGQLAQWPPYMPDRFARLTKFVTEKEILFSDAPWAIAWYSDRTAVWMPVARKQFPLMRAKADSQGAQTAGFVITPISAKVERLTDIFDGPYREWADVVYRGPMIAFQQEVRSVAEFPYNSIYPLMAAPLPETGGLNVMLVYYSDRVRWDAPKQETAKQ